MDVRCPRCAEPWEFDTLHEVAEEENSTYAEVAARFRRRGCEVITGRKCQRYARGEFASAMYEILGDDMDGAASMFDDMDMMGAWD